VSWTQAACLPLRAVSFLPDAREVGTLLAQWQKAGQAAAWQSGTTQAVPGGAVHSSHCPGVRTTLLMFLILETTS
jgi:hypothetical protein